MAPTSQVFLLIETAPGYVLVRVKEWDTLIQNLPTFQDSLLDPAKYTIHAILFIIII